MDLTVKLSEDELVIINNAINEVCNGVRIPDWEFSTRIGYDRAEALALLSKLSRLLPPKPAHFA